MINKNRKTDSLNFWFKGAALDSIKFSFPLRDTLLTKTVFFNQEPQPDSLVIKSNTKGNLSLTEPYLLSSNLPIVEIDSTKVEVFGKDSIPVPVALKILENYDRIALQFEALPNDEYTISVFPNALVDFLGNTNDTMKYGTRTKKIEDYGTIFLRLQYDDPEPFISVSYTHLTLPTKRIV